MKSLLSIGFSLGVVAMCAACPAPPRPSAADTAKYLGLEDGKTLTYAVDGGVDEKHEIRASSLLPSKDDEGGLVFDVLATSGGGFQVDERTFSIEVSLTDARIVRYGRCTPQCGQPQAPIAMFGVPLEAGDSRDGETDVDETDNGGATSTVHEKDTFVVGDLGGFTVPAGDFDAFTVTWTRVLDGTASTATLRIAPDAGIVAWDGFDGAALRLQ